MNNLKLSSWEKRPYGHRATGTVTTGERNIAVTVRSPENPAADSSTYVMANGWTAGKNSMRVPAIEAAKFGHTAITFEYTNTSRRSALQANVRDVIDIVEALPRDERKVLLGLSMGGAVMTMAMSEVGAEVSKATLVAPGKFIRAEYYSPRVIAQRMLAETLEMGQMHGHLGSGIHMLATSAGNCARRPQAVTAELYELLHGSVHEELLAVKSQPDAPYIRFMYGLQDKLLPAHAQRDSIAGLPLDEVIAYRGGHTRLAYDPVLSDEIFTMDSQSLAA